mgnify:CR=1 FL=1
MLFEKDVTKYLEESKKKLLIDIYNILFISILFLFFLYTCKYVYITSDLCLYQASFFLFLISLIFLGRFKILKKHIQISVYILLGVFSLISFVSICIQGLLVPLPYIYISILFVISLFYLNEKEFVIVTCITILLLTVSTTISKNTFLSYQNYENIEFTFLKSIWLFLFFLYIQYRIFLLKKLCKEKYFLCFEKYNYLVKMEYRNRLMGKISKCILHDISTPLSVISGSLKLLNKEDPSTIQPLLMDSIKYLECILEDALSIVDGKRNEKNFYPSSSIKKVLSLLDYRVSNSNIEVNTVLDKTLRVKGCETSFSRIFLNIFLNAVEELESTDRKKKYIYVDLLSKRKVLILKIQDNGMGISKNIIADISMGKFISNSKNHFGLGLLFVLNSVKRDFNGSIDIKSKEGEYSEIIVKIPYK